MEKVKPVDTKGNIGLFFGSFNPITNAHIEVAQKALSVTHDGIKLDEVWFVVSPHNPHKWKKGILAEENHRWNMVRLVIQALNDKNIHASNIEFFLEEKPSYTHHTLLELKQDNPDACFFIVCGTDTHQKIQTWKSAKWIHENFYFWVFPRGDKGHQKVNNQTMNARSFYLNTTPDTNISSTQIREAIVDNQSIKELTHPDVVNYINVNKVYDFLKT